MFMAPFVFPIRANTHSLIGLPSHSGIREHGGMGEEMRGKGEGQRGDWDSCFTSCLWKVPAPDGNVGAVRL